MRSARVLSVVLACLVAAFGFSMIGCGNSNDDNNAAADQAQLAQMCDDGCNTIMACAQESTGNTIPDDVIQDSFNQCLQGCTTPPSPEDITVRDCVVACDMSTDCATFLGCVCACGVDLGWLCE